MTYEILQMYNLILKSYAVGINFDLVSILLTVFNQNNLNMILTIKNMLLINLNFQ